MPPGAAAGKLCGGKLVAPFVKAATAGLLAGPAGAVYWVPSGSFRFLLVFGCWTFRNFAAIIDVLSDQGPVWLQAELHRVVEVWVADAMAAARNQGWSHHITSLAPVSPDKKH